MEKKLQRGYGKKMKMPSSLSGFLLAVIILPVPYVSQVPDGVWELPWSEACEEASVTMVEGYYSKNDSIWVDDSKRRMETMIAWENSALKKNQDTDAKEIKRLIDHEGSFRTTIKRNPSLKEITRELDKKRPVIILINMFKMYGETPLGDSYHVAVLTGYDDEKKEFTMNDPGRERKSYSYDSVMNALHDFNAKSKEANGTPTVLFTAPRGFDFGQFLKNIIDFVTSRL
jgi:hypothetical protein